MEQTTLESLILDPVFRHFYRICQIPHGSGNEQALAQYIVDWARSLGLHAGCDAVGNVFIRRTVDAQAPSVLMQAHLDMVCVDTGAARHDFQHDPIPWAISGDTLSTGGKTSLGADDGVGVALAMSMLELERDDFPNLEALFTVREEADMGGALGFDPAMSDAALLINLDHTDEHEIMCGSCGGMRADLRLPVRREPLPDGWQCARLSVSGLLGGHSGEDINKGRGNAISLLSRLLDAISRISPLGVCTLHGGIMRLAIPTEAECVVCFPPGSEAEIRSAASALGEQMRRELACSGPRLRVSLEACGPAGSCVPAAAILPALLLCPDGICAMSEALPGMVDSSDNLGEADLREDSLELVLEIRAATDSQRFYIYRRLETLAGLLGGTCSYSEAYPGWACNPTSPLTRLASRVHRELYGSEPRLTTIHAGLEPGCLLASDPNLDAISIGPNLWNLHTVEESLSISSVRRFYEYLQHVLTAIRTRRMPNGT